MDRTRIIQFIFIIFLSFIVYINTLSNGFVYDDDSQIVENTWIKSTKYIPRIFLTDVWKFSGEATSSYYRPMMHVIYTLNYQIFGLSPWGFHLVNILFHAGVSVLVFLFTQQLLNAIQFSWAVPGLSIPFLSALFFATHPIHTEVVAWVAGIPELSFTFFYLLSLIFYVKATNNRNKNLQIGVYYLSIISFIVSIFSKETAILLPMILFGHDKFIRNQSFRWDMFLKRIVPYLLIITGYFFMRFNALGGFAPLKRHVELSSYLYFINIFPLFIQYLQKLIIPANLNAFHVFHPIHSIFESKGIISLTLTLAFISLAFLFMKKNKCIIFCIFLIVVQLIPVLYIPGLGENTFAERYLYLPSIGYVILLSIFIIWLAKYIRRWKIPIFIVTVTFVILIYSIETINRNMIWRDNYTLWSDTVKKSPDGAIPHMSMGDALMTFGWVDLAIKEYQIALRLKPNNYGANINLGTAYMKKGYLDKAMDQFKIALNIKPNHFGANLNLGLAFMEKGWIDKAIDKFLYSIRLNPESAGAYNNLGLAYNRKGWNENAIKLYQIALGLNPDYSDAYNNLGIAYAEKGMIEMATRQFEAAVRLNPKDNDYRENLRRAYKMKLK
jgi:Tfp pilus assembly protein PilF